VNRGRGNQKLLARVDAVEPTPFAGQAFRHLGQDRHPLSGTGARAHGGRWNPPESFSTLYLALERETTVREFYRLAKRQGRVPEDFLPRRMYRYDVALAAVLDLGDASTRTAVHLSGSELSADDAGKCQQIGEAAHYLGLEGILAPSATGEGTVLAVFFDRRHADSQVRDLDYEPWIALPRESLGGGPAVRDSAATM
jgi:RES domain-containing protein